MEISKNITVSSKVLEQYHSVRLSYPDALILVCEEGNATALYDDAFRMYDIVCDGKTPLLFAHRPDTDGREEMVPTYTIPEDSVEELLPRIMRRTLSFVIARVTENAD